MDVSDREDLLRPNMSGRMLEGEVDLWWRTAERMLTVEEEGLVVWESSLRVFRERYFQATVRERK